VIAYISHYETSISGQSSAFIIEGNQRLLNLFQKKRSLTQLSS